MLNSPIYSLCKIVFKISMKTDTNEHTIPNTANTYNIAVITVLLKLLIFRIEFFEISLKKK